ncbi:MAG: phosphotransferase [Chloroflexi bacterium]|nr:phosphotransferase [Chloroflexota bacterium]
MPEWDPETEVAADRARALIEAQFPELRGVGVREVAAGWDNVVHLVDERWAFRFPRREIAVAGVHREIAVLPCLAEHLPLPIPEPRFVGAPTDEYPWPWFGAAFLPGVELAESGLPDEGRVELGVSLGGFLRALHAPGLASRVGSSLPVDPMRRADMGFRIPHARRRLDQVIEAGLWRSTDAVERLLTDATGLPPPSRTLVLHGDLHARHVLVDGAGRATGVIDWGDVSAGDPSVDLSIAYGSLVGDARAAFIDSYGPVDRLTELRARVIAVFLGAALLLYAADHGMSALRDDSERSLERAAT